MPTPDLFPDAPRAKPKRLMHVVDACDDHFGVTVECGHCGHKMDVDGSAPGEPAKGEEYTTTELRRGIPCPNCN